ncbi:MAG: DUF4124 domain-containing protein [Burkholderiaceae bacterium]|nr:DUF4124 domain-containing protein [Burkholderiaceae bacterium]
MLKFLTATTTIFVLSTQICFAQWIWLDEKGSKQFSDQPPPASVPKNKILKSPGRASLEPSTESKDAAASSPEKLQKPVTTASKNEDFLKRRAEQEEKDKKAAGEQQAKAEKDKACERARTYKQSLESGIRIASVDKNGERNYLDDAKRAQELAEVNKNLADCK